tara:strand:- start:145 stop:513 length:369 start_codon:yes stop_codon:yes gene_type:complete
MSDALSKLTPEMQARLAAIVAGQQPQGQPQVQPVQQAAPPQQVPAVKPPSLMDHVIALRQEVAGLRQQVSANSDVVDAVGQAVGQLYQMFQPSPELPHQSPQAGPTYSDTFQQQTVNNNDDF